MGKVIKNIYVLIFLIIGINLFGINVYIANLNIYREDLNVQLNDKEINSSGLLFKYTKKKDFEGLLNVHSVSQTIIFSDKTTKSTIEASELCELLHIDYLLYGFIKKANNYYDAEIRLFDNAKKENRKIIYVKTELTTGIDEVVNELSDKFINYMYDMLGLSEYHKERKIGFGGLGIYNAAGYWFPLNNWWNIMTGLVCFETGISVMPVTPIAKARNFTFDIRYGLYLNYSLGMSKPGYLKSYYNSLIFKIPAELCFEIFFSHVFIIGMSPQLQLDILYQKLLFDNPKISTTVAFSLMASAGYEYWFGRNKYVGLGVNNIFDFTFYKHMYYDYKIELYTIARISFEKKEKKKIEIKQDIDSEKDRNENNKEGLKNDNTKEDGNQILNNDETGENKNNSNDKNKDENDTNQKPKDEGKNN